MSGKKISKITALRTNTKKLGYFSPDNLRQMASNTPLASKAVIASNPGTTKKFDMLVYEHGLSNPIPGCGVIRPLVKPPRTRTDKKRKVSEDPLDPIEEFPEDSSQPSKKKKKINPLVTRQSTPYHIDVDMTDHGSCSSDLFTPPSPGLCTPPLRCETLDDNQASSDENIVEPTQPYASPSNRDNDMQTEEGTAAPQNTQAADNVFAFDGKKSAFVKISQAQVYIIPNNVSESPPPKPKVKKSDIHTLLNTPPSSPKPTSNDDLLSDTDILTSICMDGVECASDAHTMTQIITQLTELRSLRNKFYTLSTIEKGDYIAKMPQLSQLEKQMAEKVQNIQALLQFSLVHINNFFFSPERKNV